MAGCRFGSPDLVTSIAGNAATPTFAFDATNVNYFGLAGSFTSNNGAVCSFPTRSVGIGRTSTYAITPIIVTTSIIGRTTTCAPLAPSSIIPNQGGSTTYSGIECPSITDNRFAPGTYTLRFSQPAVNGVPTITSRIFIVASPTFSTDRTTQTVLQTATASAGFSSTSTFTSYTSTVTETDTAGVPQTSTITISGTVTSTLTETEPCPSSSNVPSTTPTPSVTPTDSTTVDPTTTPLVSTAVSPSVSSTGSPTSDPPVSSVSSSSASTPTASLVVSPNGVCGAASGQTCLGSTIGNCCSSYGFCGNTDIYCLTTEGCQSEFGTCNTPTPVSTSALPTSTSKVSTDGSCGGINGLVCTGSGFGDCCSPYGWCGASTAHCGAGCQNPFGTCSGSPTTLATITGTAPEPTSTIRVSLDGLCGGTTGQTCQGSDFGNCCSEYGYCGNTEIYCAAGCQPAFGTCPVAPAGKKRSLMGFANNMEKRAIGGAGPDYTYPPIPRTTITSTTTVSTTVTATSGVLTTTVFAATTTTISSSGSVGTVTQSLVIGTTTVTVKETATGCGVPSLPT